MRIELLKGIETLEELKSAYRKLAFKYHPDKATGSVELMQKLNAEYEYLSKRLKNKEGKTEQKEHSEEFIKVVEELIKLDGLLIEVVGTWLWISGDTFKHKSIFNKYKMKWNKMRKLWQYDSTGEYKRTKNKRSDEEIKNYFGSEVIADNRNKRSFVLQPN